MNNILDKSTDIAIICLGISMVIFVTIFSINLTDDYVEQECVEFYKETNYITDSCEVYREKLEGIKK